VPGVIDRVIGAVGDSMDRLSGPPGIIIEEGGLTAQGIEALEQGAGDIQDWLDRVIGGKNRGRTLSPEEYERLHPIAPPT